MCLKTMCHPKLFGAAFNKYLLDQNFNSALRNFNLSLLSLSVTVRHILESCHFIDTCFMYFVFLQV